MARTTPNLAAIAPAPRVENKTVSHGVLRLAAAVAAVARDSHSARTAIVNQLASGDVGSYVLERHGSDLVLKQAEQFMLARGLEILSGSAAGNPNDLAFRLSYLTGEANRVILNAATGNHGGSSCPVRNGVTAGVARGEAQGWAGVLNVVTSLQAFGADLVDDRDAMTDDAKALVARAVEVGTKLTDPGTLSADLKAL